MSESRHDAIRETAYLLWKQDGEPVGNDQHYWFLAEQVVDQTVADSVVGLPSVAAPRKTTSSKKAPAKSSAAAKTPVKAVTKEEAPAPAALAAKKSSRAASGKTRSATSRKAAGVPPVAEA